MKNFNPNLFIALVVIFGLILGVKYAYYDDLRQEGHPAVNEIAVKPDDMFRNANHYYRDYHQRLTSIQYINKAIETMEVIEKDMDSISNQLIEEAIADLKNLVTEFEKKEVNEYHMEHAFANALNSLAYAQLRVSEYYLEQGREQDAEAATKYAIKHLHSAMYFSEEAQFRAEQHIVELVEELQKEENLTEEEVRLRIHEAVGQLDEVLANVDLSEHTAQNSED
jgi:hypothetical protein